MFNTPHPFLQFVMPRVRAAEARLREQLWHAEAPVKVAYVDRDEMDFAAAKRAVYADVKLPFHWGRLMQTRWFHLDFPKVSTDKPLYLHWEDQGEGTLYFDEAPYYGFDVAHKHVLLPENCKEGYMESLCLQSGIWHPNARGMDAEGSLLAKADVMTRNDDVWHALIDLEVLSGLAMDEQHSVPGFGGLHEGGVGNKPMVNVVSPLLRRLLRGLDDAVNALDAGGVSAMRTELASVMQALQSESSLVKGVLTGHAHIDLVWLWREINGEYKARHTFSSMNRLMELYPEFRFAYSQSASYEAVARTCPAQLDQVKTRIAEGKWEAVGATYVESDTLVACGEALARSFLVGQDKFRELFGESSTLLWLPDVFGYAGCLPQIMIQCGVTRFFTTKLTWSNINLFPHSSFLWRGVDGSEVLSHVTQGVGYNQNALPQESRKAANEYRQSDVHDEFLQPTGFGDGGGGVTPEMCERARRLESLSGVPSTTWGRLDDFYDGLEKVKENLPVYQGELYLEYHRGTVTTHGNLKESFRGLEKALQVQEAAHTLTGAGSIDPHAWQRLVFSQFHDYIPGSSIWEVYEEGLPELNRLADEAYAKSGALLGGKGSCVTNLLPMKRKFTSAAGVVELPPLSSVALDELTAEPDVHLGISGLELSSSRVHAAFNASGEVVALSVDGEPVPFTEPANAFVLYPDYPHAFDAWDIDRQTLHLGQKVDTQAERVEWKPEVGVGMAFAKAIGEQSRVIIRYWIDPAQPVLQIELELDWKEKSTLLKTMFPTDYQGRFARFGAPYNSVLRSQQPGDLKDEAMFESCASRWVTVMDDSQSAGLSLITQNKYGVSCRDGNLGLSLVRSVRVTGEDPGHRKIFVKSLRDGSPRAIQSDLQTHTLRYALGGFSSQSPREETAAALADILYTPVLPSSEKRSAGLKGYSGGESLIPAWSKPLDDGSWILRLHEVYGRQGTLDLELDEGWIATQTDLSERDASDADTSFAFRGYEIVSLRIFTM
jgi:alpha-mannosidase